MGATQGNEASSRQQGNEATRQEGAKEEPRASARAAFRLLRRRRIARAHSRVLGVALLAMAATGCSRESLQVALAAQQRADQVQQAVFDRQHDGLRVLLYRDLRRKLDQDGEPLTDAQQETLNNAWNERDLVEFWMVQFERAKALRLIGVDAKLYSDQSVVDLLLKSLSAKTERGEQALAAWAGATVAEQAEDGGAETSSDNVTK